MVLISGRSPACSMLKLALPLTLTLLMAVMVASGSFDVLTEMMADAGSAHETGHENHGANCPKNQKSQDGSVAAEVAGSASVEPSGPAEARRTKRQITELIKPGNPDSNSNNPFSQIGDLSSQIDRFNAPLKMISQLFGQNQNKQQQQPPQTYEQTIPAAINQAAAAQQNPLSLPNASQFMSQLTELIRPPRDSNSNTMASQMQQTSQQAGQQGLAAAQNAQGGIAAALAEIGQGLQRIASNNPSLVPDVKSLYSSVSGKLSSASQSVGQAAGQPAATSANIAPAQNSQQLADNLAKLAFPGVQTPA